MLLIKSFDFLQGKQTSIVMLGLGFWMCFQSGIQPIHSSLIREKSEKNRIEKTSFSSSTSGALSFRTQILISSCSVLPFCTLFTCKREMSSLEEQTTPSQHNLQLDLWAAALQRGIKPFPSAPDTGMQCLGRASLFSLLTAVFWCENGCGSCFPAPSCQSSGSLWCSCTAKDQAPCFSLQLQLTGQTCPNGNNSFFPGCFSSFHERRLENFHQWQKLVISLSRKGQFFKFCKKFSCSLTPKVYFNGQCLVNTCNCNGTDGKRLHPFLREKGNIPDL